ncbi:hypothetical protein [Alteromonas sp. CYL-A6]|uniref:hypothetical protein n=1 Tax=Alteromonas nitratireducens TaxID=3390813 RepID=UPI0034A810F2
MTKTTVLRVRPNIETLAIAMARTEMLLNGTYLRPVEGKLYPSEGIKRLPFTPSRKSLNERQEKINFAVLPVANPKKKGANELQKIQVEKLIGNNSFDYCCLPRLTYAFEEMYESSRVCANTLYFVTLHLNTIASAKAASCKAGFSELKQQIKRGLQKAFGSSVRGFMVFERSKHREYVKSIPGRILHVHIVLEAEQLDPSRIRSGITQYLDLVLSGEDTAINIKVDQGKAFKHGRGSTVLNFDMGLSDYLCKGLDDRIVPGAQNYFTFNMSDVIRQRHEWRFKQQAALRREFCKLQILIAANAFEGDLDERLMEVINSVPKPTALPGVIKRNAA